MLVSSDKKKLDILFIHEFLTRSYWAKGRTLEEVKQSIKNALCFGLYLNNVQIGFARVITDTVTFGYIADVFVTESERGKGYSRILINKIFSHKKLTKVQNWYLITKDAQGLYKQFGFKNFKMPHRTIMYNNKPIKMSIAIMKRLDFNKEYVLENEIIKLRPLEEKDFDTLSHFALTEPSLWEYSLLPADGLENMQTYLSTALKDRANKKAYPFIVYDKRKKAYAGSTRLYEYDSYHNTAYLGYTWYGKAFQGTGLNKNCKYLLLEFAFETLGLDRVEFRADNKNERSIAAMISIGCKTEGVLRNNCTSPTGRRDSIVLSILKNEWFDSVKPLLKHKSYKEDERFKNSI